jgi:hypothetical protein
MTGLHHKLGYDRITSQVLSNILEIARLVTVLFGTVSLLDTPEEGRTNPNTGHSPYVLVVTVSILLTVSFVIDF